MTAHFGYTQNSPNRALGRIQSRHHFIEHGTDLFHYRASVSSFGLKARTCFPVASRITSLKGIPRSCVSFWSNQGINASTGVFFVCLRRGNGLRLNVPDKHGPRHPDPEKARGGSHKHSPK